MSANESPLWNGLKPEIRTQLHCRDYAVPSVEERIASIGMDAGTVLATERALREQGVWIPGVELIHRTIYPQRHRGVFGELGRKGEGTLGKIGLWPRQWAAAHMYAGSAKGFHVHPPHVPEGRSAEEWFHYLYVQDEENFALRPYDKEQWDVMCFLKGHAEIILADERIGLPRRIMRFFIDGDNHRGANNVAVVIPAGVAHAIRSESSEDLIMVYGTTTTFHAPSEGRIAAEVETSKLPVEWAAYLKQPSA